jgi:hypothetical protein
MNWMARIYGLIEKAGGCCWVSGPTTTTAATNENIWRGAIQAFFDPLMQQCEAQIYFTTKPDLFQKIIFYLFIWIIWHITILIYLAISKWTIFELVGRLPIAWNYANSKHFLNDKRSRGFMTTSELRAFLHNNAAAAPAAAAASVAAAAVVVLIVPDLVSTFLSLSLSLFLSGWEWMFWMVCLNRGEIIKETVVVCQCRDVCRFYGSAIKFGARYKKYRFIRNYKCQLQHQIYLNSFNPPLRRNIQQPIEREFDWMRWIIAPNSHKNAPASENVSLCALKYAENTSALGS